MKLLITFLAVSLVDVSITAITDCNSSPCGPNEVYRECQPCAAVKCGDIAPQMCAAICQNPGCFCRDGFLRNENGICVPEFQCPPTEIFRECKPCAAIYCGQIPPKICTDICEKPGFYCRDGFLRNEHGICVPSWQC